MSRLNTQGDADVLQQNRTTAEAVSVSAAPVEAERRMKVAVLVMRRITLPTANCRVPKEVHTGE